MSPIPTVAPQTLFPSQHLQRNILIQAVRTPKLLLVTSLALAIIATLAYFLLTQLKNRSTRPRPLNDIPPSKPSISATTRSSIGISRADFEARVIKEYMELEKLHPIKDAPSIEAGFSSVALLPENQPFNVYPNIIPFEDNQVRGVPFYFNASWIYRQIPSFLSHAIACQGPTQNQHARFWHLALKTQTRVIVTLSLPDDRSIYWPEKNIEPLQFEDTNIAPVTVSKLSEEAADGIIKRQFIVTDDSLGSNIIQLHIPDWPDHERVPIGNVRGVISKEKLAAALQMLDELLQETKGNFIVHCVAGTGRTGTFLAAFETFKRLKYGCQKLSPDVIWKIAVEGRSQEVGRNGFIRSYDQYLLIYDTLMKMFPSLNDLLLSKPSEPS